MTGFKKFAIAPHDLFSLFSFRLLFFPPPPALPPLGVGSSDGTGRFFEFKKMALNCLLAVVRGRFISASAASPLLTYMYGLFWQPATYHRPKVGLNFPIFERKTWLPLCGGSKGGSPPLQNPEL